MKTDKLDYEKAGADDYLAAVELAEFARIQIASVKEARILANSATNAALKQEISGFSAAAT